MHSNRYTAAPERKHRNLPRVLAATAAMLCIAALLLVLSVVQSHTAAAVRNRDGFRLRSGENVFYSAAGNGLAAATTTGECCQPAPSNESCTISPGRMRSGATSPANGPTDGVRRVRKL